MHLQTAILSQVQKKSNPLMKDVLPSFSAKKKNIFLKVDAFKTLETQAALTGSQAFATLSRTLQVWHGWSQERRT